MVTDSKNPMEGSKKQHTKALLDMLEYACNSVDRDINSAIMVTSLAMTGWERVSVRFDDGFGVELTFNVDDEECTR